MRLLFCLIFFVTLSLVGCGDSGPAKPGNPTKDQIAADEAEQKRVEEEERGTPIKGKKKK